MKLQKDYTALRQRCGHELQELKGKQQTLSNVMHQYDVDRKEIEQWLQEHDMGLEEVDIDQATQPETALALQYIELMAEDYTLDDVIYHLDKELGNGNCDPDVWLKTLRQVSRQQFEARALAMKCRTELVSLGLLPSSLGTARRPEC
jgi:ESCRT-I complex subunit TSG101